MTTPSNPITKSHRVLAAALGQPHTWTTASIAAVSLYVLTPIYAVAMLVCPWFATNGSWKHVHQVWYDWQSLNVGMLALISSAIVFKAAKYQSDAQRRRDFRAAQAFLPEAISELARYLKSCATALDSAWHAAIARRSADGTSDPAVATPPTLPESHREVFAQCIRFAEPEVGDFLATTLAKLQVLNSRLSGLLPNTDPDRRIMVIHGTDAVLTYLHSLAILQMRINRLYPFARNEEPLDIGPATWDEAENAYRNLELRPGEYECPRVGTLEAFSQRWVQRQHGKRF